MEPLPKKDLKNSAFSLTAPPDPDQHSGKEKSVVAFGRLINYKVPMCILRTAFFAGTTEPSEAI